MRNGRMKGLKYSQWKRRMTVFLLAIMALGFVSACGEEKQRDPSSKDDVGQSDVQNYEDVGDTDDVERDPETDVEISA